MSPKPKLYLDTSALNYLRNNYIVKERRSDVITQRYDVLVSLYLLAEVLSCSDKDLSQKLAFCLWKMTDHRILIPAEELIFAEVRNALGLDSSLDYFPLQMRALKDWESVSWGAMNRHDLDNFREYWHGIKEGHKAYMKAIAASQEEIIAPFLRSQGTNGMMQEWPFELAAQITNGHIQAAIYNCMEQFCTNNPTRFPRSRLPERELVLGVDYRLIPCTATSCEYNTALAYCVLCKKFDPDKGDSEDMKHAFYAGFADVFVTRDDRMFMILNDMVISKRAEIVKAEEFVASLRD